MIQITSSINSAFGSISVTTNNVQDGKVSAYYAESIPFCSQILLSQAGTLSVNGNYSVAGTYNGYNLYTKDGNPNSYPRIRNHISSTYWEIINSSPIPNAQIYITTNMGSCPALLNWEQALGLPEPPTFSIIN